MKPARMLLLAAALGFGLATTPAPVPPSPAAPAEIAAPPEVAGLLGYDVLSTTGAHLGRIVDVLVDARGVVRGVVIDIGGFMGLGARKVAVAWRALSFSSSKNGPVVTVGVDAERIRKAPEVLPDKPIVMLDVPNPGIAK
jgi:sporulation protein YlmC with PRC-barrel domain